MNIQEVHSHVGDIHELEGVVQGIIDVLREQSAEIARLRTEIEALSSKETSPYEALLSQAQCKEYGLY